MRPIIAAAALATLAACAVPPSPMSRELDAVVQDAREAAQAARARRPAYAEMCRAQMPRVSDEAVRACADRMVSEDMARIEARTERRIEAIGAAHDLPVQRVRVVR